MENSIKVIYLNIYEFLDLYDDSDNQKFVEYEDDIVSILECIWSFFSKQIHLKPKWAIHRKILSNVVLTIFNGFYTNFT